MFRHITRRPCRSPFTRAGLALPLLAAIGVLLTAAPLTAQPRVLGQLSQEAQAAVIVPNLAETNRKLATLKQRLELPVPAMADLLSAFRREAEMSSGINDSGALAIVFQDLDQAMNNQSDPTVFLLVPVIDYGSFVGNYDGSADEPITELTMPRHVAYARRLGNHALLGKSEQAVADYQPVNDATAITQQIGSFASDYLDEADAALYVDLKRLRPSLMQYVDQASSQVQQMGAVGPSTNGPLNALQSTLSATRTLTRNVIESSNAMVVTLELDREGIALTKALSYEAGSPLAQIFKSGDISTKNKLAQLPNQSYIFAMAIDTKAVAVGQALQNHLQAAGDRAPSPDLVLSARALPLIERVQSAATAFYVPTQQALMSGGFLDSVNIYQVDDADQFRQQFKRYIEGLNGLSVAMDAANNGDNAPEVSFTASYTSNALNLAGTSVDQYRIRQQVPPRMRPGQGGPMGMLLSMQSITGYLITHDNHVATTTRPDPQLVRQALSTMQAGTGIGSDDAMQTLRQNALPTDPVAEGYLSVRGMAQTANLFLPMLGAPKLQAPDGLPPISVGLSTDGRNAVGRLYLPIETVRFIIDAREQIMDANDPDQ